MSYNITDILFYLTIVCAAFVVSLSLSKFIPVAILALEMNHCHNEKKKKRK